MVLVSFFRVVKFAVQNFWRNFWLSLVTVTIIVLALFSFTLLWGVNAVAEAAVTAVENKVNLTLYFRTDVDNDHVLQIGKGMSEWSEVASVDFVSPEEALANFQVTHAGDPLILESLEELEGNPLGASLVVHAVDLVSYSTLLGLIDDLNVDELLQKKDFQDHETIIAKLRTVRERITQIGIIISAIFAVIAVLVVFNTIRIGIYTRREEIGIMRLVGGSNWFIRMPYVVEGVLYAIIAVTVFWVVFFAILKSVEPFSAILFSDLGFDIIQYFQTNFLFLLAWQFAGMVLLNLVSISFAMGRYMRV